MSKIQKALKILQDARAVPELRRDRESREVHGRAAAEQPDHLTDSRQDAEGGDTVADSSAFNRPEERPLSASIHVPTAALVKQGILPATEWRELVEQQFRRIKRPVLNIAFGDSLNVSGNANLIMVASALPRSGKTFCSINLALSIAREKDVGAVLVDADVLKPNISRALGFEDRVGLIDYLVDDSISMDDILISTDLGGTIVVPAGRQHDDSTELLASRRMAQLCGLLSERFSSRAILVDTPPLLVTNEAQVLADHMGQIIIVVEAGCSEVESINEALSTLDRSKPINAILNKARGSSFGDYGGYGYDSES